MLLDLGKAILSLWSILFIMNKSLSLAHTHGGRALHRVWLPPWQSCQTLLTRYPPGPDDLRDAKHGVLILPKTTLPH